MATYRPAVSGDDGYWGVGVGGDPFDNGFAVAKFGTFFTGVADCRSFYRFPAVAITQGAVIASATLTLRAELVMDGTSIAVVVRGDDQDNAATITDATDGNGRTLTTASVAWTITSWDDETDITSPDIKTVIQEIVDRPGWASGNAILLHIVDSASVNGSVGNSKTYDSSTTNCARLELATAGRVSVGWPLIPGLG